jgi:hypothetical protein
MEVHTFSTGLPEFFVIRLSDNYLEVRPVEVDVAYDKAWIWDEEFSDVRE